MRFALLLLTFSCWIAAVRAGIFEGFAKEMPSLEDIPDIAEQVRKLWDPSSRMMNYASGEEDRHLLQTATATPTSGQTTSGQNIPADFNKQGALSFVVMMDEFGYNNKTISLGTKFAFSGRLAANSLQVGNSSGTCTIDSSVNTNSALCTLYLSFSTNSSHGFGTVAVSGNTDKVGGYLQVIGTAGDVSSTTEGVARVVFDSSGNPIIYVMVSLN